MEILELALPVETVSVRPAVVKSIVREGDPGPLMVIVRHAVVVATG
jgi:hypothetical protein